MYIYYDCIEFGFEMAPLNIQYKMKSWADCLQGIITLLAKTFVEFLNHLRQIIFLIQDGGHICAIILGNLYCKSLDI